MNEIEAVLAAARALLFVREEPPNSNAGQAVEAILNVTGLVKGYPWCAAYVAYVGLAALGEKWPLPATASCAQLGVFAESRGLLVEQPTVGDVFLLFYPSLDRFAHTGFVLGRGATLEGNTSGGGSREGWGVFARSRIWKPQDRFIRWTRLLEAP